MVKSGDPLSGRKKYRNMQDEQGVWRGEERSGAAFRRAIDLHTSCKYTEHTTIGQASDFQPKFWCTIWLVKT